MLGNNELRLNGATMQRIVQEWIDRDVQSRPQVSDVSYHAGEHTFIVRLTDPIPDCNNP